MEHKNWNNSKWKHEKRRHNHGESRVLTTEIDFFEIDFLGAKKFRNFGLFRCQKVPFPKSFGTFYFLVGRTVREKDNLKAKSRSKKSPYFLLFAGRTVRSKKRLGRNHVFFQNTRTLRIVLTNNPISRPFHHEFP